VFSPRSPSTDQDSLDRLPIVVWNVHLGAGAVDSLIADLRNGRITGSSETHFLLLLQEVSREMGGVPVAPSDDVRSADRIQPGSGQVGSMSIERVAQRNDLHLVYVPSMRNGKPGDGGIPEDRGNAILSSLPLRDVEAVEIPVEVQRRVVVAATVSGETATPGGGWSLRVATVHLDHRASWTRLHESLGANRARQAQRVVEAFAEEHAIVVAGDLNTWLRGNAEEAVRVLRESFPLPSKAPPEATYPVPGLPDWTLDHLFARLPEGWSAEYRVLPESYGSDHRPLLGWVTFGPQGGGRGPAAPAVAWAE
jgi:endonuclease/exonuclease/phosphatase family metal-dependent hydrolase